MNSCRALFFLALLIASASTFRGASAQERHPLRVMTWNIAAGHGDLSRIAAVIREVNPDIAALQEVDVHWHERSGFVDQASRLGALLGMHARFAPIYRLPGSGTSPQREFGTAILSRHPLIEVRNHTLTRLSTQSPVAEPELMPGFAEALIDVNSARLHVFNTHLDYRADPRVRVQQVTEMIARVEGVAGPMVLMGDLNAPPDAAELQPLFSRLVDAWPRSGDLGFTYPGEQSGSAD